MASRQTESIESIYRHVSAAMEAAIQAVLEAPPARRAELVSIAKSLTDTLKQLGDYSLASIQNRNCMPLSEAGD